MFNIVFEKRCGYVAASLFPVSHSLELKVAIPIILSRNLNLPNFLMAQDCG